MPDIITPGTGPTYDTIPVTPPEEDGGVTLEITEPEEGDSVELSGEPEAPVTYGPTQFSDRFKFDIANGMFDASLRFNANRTRNRGASVEAYNERRGVEFQVTQTAGRGSATTALFALQFQEADPNSIDATSQVEARTEYARMAEQNLNLLATL